MSFFRKSKKKVLVLWYTYKKNLGDYYIYATVKGYLQKWGYDIIDMDVGLPYEKIAKVAKRCDFMWFAGGGIIERWIPDIILNFKKFYEISNQIKYGVSGLSIGGFSYDNNADCLSYWIEKSAFFFSRDKYTAFELNRLSNSNKVTESVDVVFALDLSTVRDLSDDYLGINFRELPYKDITGEFQWNNWENEIRKISTQNVIVIPDQDDVSSYITYDLTCKYSPQNALNIISKCDFLIAMRYHVVLLAARMGKLSIPICYCPKVERLAEQLGLNHLMLNIDGYDKLEDKMNLLLENKINLENSVKEKVEENEKVSQQMFCKIKCILEKELF